MNNIEKLVSIIVPVYKVEQYLCECVDSILAQSYEKIEVILVDDGSPDSCPQLCDNYAAKDTRIKVIHKSNGGLSDARNAGLHIAKGVYINFCDSDDMIAPTMIKTLVTTMENKNADVVGCESLSFQNGEAKIIPHYHKENAITEFDGFEYISGFFDFINDCSVCNKLYKREIIGNSRFEKGKTVEDILFQYEVLKKCNKIVVLNNGLYLYRVNADSITQTFNVNSMNLIYNGQILRHNIEQDYPQLLSKINAFNSHNSYWLGRCLQKSGRKKEACFKPAIKIMKHELWMAVVSNRMLFKPALVSTALKYLYVIISL